ncbi:sensor histidine kinase [Mucilaginibacter jinjuensis]|uniref:histidine kinase n=1 Tax=Mucilaginibacter jinjuensis TaxID=1176721 RepID=A0ABY7TDF5_9SPHI|nr:sensor histidine kinase [Mucilaginibacter jinjuensis]WCT14184.1 PAS domain S-box protein [Mucilaginibacter jinjuensis]
MHKKLELYEKVTPLAQLGIWQRNLVTGEIYWNQYVRDIYEVGPDVLYLTLEEAAEFYLDQDIVRSVIEYGISSGEPQVGEFRLRSARGVLKWVKMRIHANYEDGECTIIYGTLEDITSQVNMIRALEEREEKFHQAFDYAPIGMALVAPDGHWIKVNNSLCSLLGYDEEEFLKHTFQDFTHPDDLDLDLSHMYRLLNNEITTYNIEKRYFHKLGHQIWIYLSVTLVRDADSVPLYFVSQIKDITDRKRSMEILLRERQRLDNILKSTQVGTWEWHIPTDETVYNKRSAAILGYLPNELGADTMAAWHDLIHPDDRDINALELEKCFKKEEKFYACECRMMHKNGDWIWVEVRGKVVKWSDDDKPLLMLGTYADIHDRKAMEQERKQAMEVISGQNGRLLNFAHIVSHNLRSHTGNIQMLLDMITHETDDEEKQKMMQMLVINTANLQQTLAHLNDVVDVHSNKEYSKKILNLHQEIHRMLEVLSLSLRQVNAKLSVDVDPGISIQYDPAYLESILLNLLTNSIKYRHPDRALHIDIKVYELNNIVTLEITDNGIGIDLGLHGHKLFGMYKTFHDNNDARGIGLFLVKNQVDAMGGKIEARSTVNEGTTFKIEFS